VLKSHRNNQNKEQNCKYTLSILFEILQNVGRCVRCGGSEKKLYCASNEIFKNKGLPLFVESSDRVVFKHYVFFSEGFLM